MARKELKVNIIAFVEYDDQEYEKKEVEEAIVIAFRLEDSIADTELFLPQLNSMQVIEYIEVNVDNVDNVE